MSVGPQAHAPHCRLGLDCLHFFKDRPSSAQLPRPLSKITEVEININSNILSIVGSTVRAVLDELSTDAQVDSE